MQRQSSIHLTSNTERSFKNLKYQGRQDAHGIRHVASTALIEKGHNRDMVSRCLGHLKNDGAIVHCDFSLQLDKRKDIHESRNQLLMTEGLKNLRI